MKLKDALKDENELYYIGSGSAFICIIKKDQYDEHIKYWNEFYEKKTERDALAKLKWARNTIQKEKGSQMRKCLYAGKKLLDKALHEVVAWKDLQSREVKDIHKRIFGGTVIEIEGSEVGQSWEKEEYERLWKKKCGV